MQATDRVIEALENRLMLAADFVYSAANSTSPLNAELTNDSSDFQLINANTGQTIQSIPLSNFSGNVSITGSALADTIAVNVSVPLQTVSINGGAGNDKVLILSDISTGGQDVDITASTITVGPNVTISTKADGIYGTSENSGAIDLTGSTITVSAGAQLLAGVDVSSAYTAGDITLDAVDDASLAASIAQGLATPVLTGSRDASVNITGAVIDGGDVTVSSDAETEISYLDDGSFSDSAATQLLGTISQLSDLAVAAVTPISGEVKIETATGNVVLTDTTITATGAASVTSTTNADASFTAVGINAAASAKSPFLATIGFGEADTTANVELDGSTSITAMNDVTVESSTSASAESEADPVGNNAATESNSVDLAASLAVGETNETSTVSTGVSTVVDSKLGNVFINAVGDGDTSGETDAQLFRDGVGGLTVGIAIDKSDINSTVNGTVTAEDPQGEQEFIFNNGQVVNAVNNTITLSEIDPADEISRGEELTYEAGGTTTVGGLTTNTTYTVANVVSTATEADGTLTQTFQLSTALPIHLDTTQIQPGSVQTVSQLEISTFDSSAVTNDGSGDLAIKNSSLSTPLITGDMVTYAGTSEPVSLTNLAATFALSPGGDTITRTDGGPTWDAEGLLAGDQITISNASAAADNGAFTIKSISDDGNTLTLTAANKVVAGSVSAFSLASTITAPTMVGNLTNDTQYSVIVNGSGQVLLKDPTGASTYIKYSSTGSGLQGFTLLGSALSFSPATAVDNTQDTIELPNNTLQTGDVVIYNTDPNLRFTQNLYDFPDDGSAPVMVGTASVPDAPIDNLTNGNEYFVVRVDATHIQLAQTRSGAEDAAVIAITPGTGAGIFDDASDFEGVQITATLSASNDASAGLEVSSDDESYSDAVLNSSDSASDLAGAILGAPAYLQSLSGAANTAAPMATALDGIPLTFAATFAFNIDQHTVQAIVGPTAVVTSGADLQVGADIEESTQVDADAEPTRNGLDQINATATGKQRMDIELAVAFAYNSNVNSTEALVDPNAVLDATGALSVTATTDYAPLSGTVPDALNPQALIADDGLQADALLLDGDLGLTSDLLNSSVMTLAGNAGADTDFFVIGAGVDVEKLTNVATATISAGAQINQNQGYQSYNQAVDVDATNSGFIASAVQQGAENLSVDGATEAVDPLIKAGDLKSSLLDLYNPFGLNGQDMVGPGIIDTEITNTTSADVQSGANLRTGVGPGGGLTINAEDTLTSFDFAQTGGTAGSFGLTASITVGTINDSTTSELGKGAMVFLGPVTVEANDDTDRYSIDGSVLDGDKAGVGISIGVNTINRATSASIGDAADTAAGSTIDLPEPGTAVVVEAENSGSIEVIGLAGAKLSTNPMTPTAATTTAPPAKPTGGFSLAIGASVADNQGTDSVEAYVLGSTISAGSLSVTATDRSNLDVTVAGGALDSTTVSKTDIGIGGAFAFNNLSGNVSAFVEDSKITVAGTSTSAALDVQAIDDATIYADGGGVALITSLGPKSAKNLSAGVGVAVNQITSSAIAYVDSSPVNSSAGDVDVDAEYEPTINAETIGAAGAVAPASTGTSINTAGAGSASQNVIVGGAQAYLTNDSVFGSAGIITAGNLNVTATDTSSITADAGAAALALSLSTGGSSLNLSVAASVALNQITGTTSAFLNNTTVAVAGAMMVLATAQSTIEAVTLGGAVSAGTGTAVAASGAGSGNTIIDVTTAYIHGGGNLTVAAGDKQINTGALTVQAIDTDSITVDAGGFAIALSISSGGRPSSALSVGVGAAENTITSTTTANIQDTNVSAASVEVHAESNGTINALSMGGAGAASASAGSAFNFAGAGAGSGNTITATTTADIADTNSADGGTTVTTPGYVEVTAEDTSAITANAGAIALTLGFSQGSTNFNASIGVSVAVNTLTPTVSATIDNATVNAGQSVTTNAGSFQSIQALTIAGAGAVGLSSGSGVGFSLAGAGTGSGNVINGKTLAEIDKKSSVTSSAVLVSATDGDSITATAASGSLSLSLGASGGSVSLGVAIADNTITQSDLAVVDGATVDPSGAMTVTSLSTDSITTTSVGAAFSLSIGKQQGFNLAVSGAGAQSTNSIDRTVEAYVTDGATVKTNANGSVLISASDSGTINSSAGGGSLALSASPGGITGSAAVSTGLSANTVTDTVESYASGTGTTVTAGSVNIDATSSTSINSTAVSVAAAVSVTDPLQGFSVAVAGAGASSINTIINKIAANVGGNAMVTAGGSVGIAATDAATIMAIVPADSVAISLGLSIATTATVTTDLVNDSVDADITSATVKSGSGVTVRAASTGTIIASDVPVAVSGGLISVAGQGGNATVTIGGHTNASIGAGAIVVASGDVDVTAGVTSTVSASTEGGGGGFLDVGVMLADAEIPQTVQASLDGNANISGANVNVTTYGLNSGDPATSARSATALVITGQVAIVGGQGGSATANISGAVNAEVASGVTVNATGKMTVAANSASTDAGNADAGSFGGINVTALTASATTSGKTTAEIDQNASVKADSLDVTATAAKSTTAGMTVIGIGLINGVGGKSTATDSADTDATIGADTGSTPNIDITDEMTVSATASEATTSTTTGGTGGVVTAGVLLASAQSSGSTNAALGNGADVYAGSLTLAATDPSRVVTATDTSGAAAFANVSSAGATTNVTGNITATVGDNATITTPDFGTTSVTATNIDTQANSVATGTTVGLGFAVGVFSSTADVTTNITATIGQGAAVQTGGLTIASNDATSATSQLQLVAASVLVGVSKGTSSAIINSNSTADIGEDGTKAAAIRSPGSVSITATSTDATADTENLGGGGGGAGVATASASTVSYNKTFAGIGPNDSVMTGGNVSVVAKNNGESADTQLTAGTGGLFSIGTTQATATSTPQVLAVIDSTANLQVSGNFTLTATDGGEAISNAQSFGGGAIEVGVAESHANFTPIVNAEVNSAATVYAKGNVIVASYLNDTPTSTPPSDVITQINSTNNTVDFAYPLTTGTTVVLQTPANTTATGQLVSGASYNVIVAVPGQSLQFGDAFDASSQVNPLSDIISFASDPNLAQGEAVALYANGGNTILVPGQGNASNTYYVRWVQQNPNDSSTANPLQIRLDSTPAQATADESTLLHTINGYGEDLAMNSGTFTVGEALTYRSNDAQAFQTEDVDATETTATYTDANGNTHTGPDVTRNSAGVGLHTPNNVIVIPNHGFSSGDAVTYTATNGSSPIGGLVSGQTYYVIRIDDNQLELAATYLQAVGLSQNSDHAGIEQQSIKLTVSGAQNGTHTLSRDLSGLKDNQTYYVVGTGSNNSISIASTPGGFPIFVGDTSVYYVTDYNGNVSLNTVENRGSGAQRLGNEGLDLQAGTMLQDIVIKLANATLPTGSYLEGVGGVPLALLAPIGTVGASSATALGGDGGGIDVSTPTAVLTITPSVDVTINQNANIIAGGSITISDTGETNGSSDASTNGGGFITDGTANDNTYINNADTLVQVDDGATVQATGSVIINVVSNHQIASAASSHGGGFAGGRLAEDASVLTGETEAVIGGDVTAGSLLSVETNVALTANSDADAYAIGEGVGADADTRNSPGGIGITDPSTVMIDPGATLTGGAVSLYATVSSVTANSVASAEAIVPILFGVASAFADSIINIYAPATVDIYADPNYGGTTIDGAQGVDIKANTATPVIKHDSHAQAIAIIPPQKAQDIGTVTVTGTVFAQPNALIIAGVRGQNTSLSTFPNQTALSLYVDGQDGTNWNANVLLNSAAAADLNVNAAGQITAANGVTATVANGKVTVNSIAPPTSGQIVFTGGGTVSGSQGTFTFSNNFNTLDINSDYGQLVLGNITSYTTTDVEPKVTIDVPTNGLTFNVNAGFSSTMMTITDATTAGILLTGTINNPIGSVSISTLGSIVSQNFATGQGTIIANFVGLYAGQNIGGTATGADRVGIEIVESTGLYSQIQAIAGGNLYVGDKAVNRSSVNASGTNFTSTSNGSDPSLFQAGGLADILLGAAVNQTTNTTKVGGVQVYETATVTNPSSVTLPNVTPKTTPRTTTVYHHFRVDTGTAPTAVLGIVGTGTTAIAVTYNLGTVQAGTTINIHKDTGVSAVTNVTSYVDLIPSAAAVSINANTNGYIDLYGTTLNDIAGIMPIGVVESTANDVDLAAAATGGGITNASGGTAANVIGRNITLYALAGGIGTSAAALNINSSYATTGAVSANAKGAIYLDETTGNMNITLVKSNTSDVSLTDNNAALLDADTGTAAHVIGNTLTFKTEGTTANADGVGTTGHDLIIDSSYSGAGGLNVTSSGRVGITQTLGALNVLGVTPYKAATVPNVYLTTRDASTNTENINVNGNISGGTVTLTAGDNFTLPAGVTIKTTGTLTIQIDPAVGDADTFGATATVDGVLNATSVNINGGAQNDTFNLVPEPTSNNFIMVNGNAPEYPVTSNSPYYPGDVLNFNAETYTYTRTVGDVTKGSGGIASGGHRSISFVDIEEVVNTHKNAPPVNSLPANFTTATTPIVLSVATGNQLSVTDPDAGGATNFQVKLVTSSGTVALIDAASTLKGYNVTETGTGTAASPLILTGAFQNITSILFGGVKITPAANFSGLLNLTMTSNDEGNTGTGGAMTDVDTLGITIVAAHDQPPVNTLPIPFGSTASPIPLSTAAGTAISVADPDAGNGNETVTLTEPSGTLSLINTTGLTFTSTGTGTSTLSITATLATLNKILSNGVNFTPTPGFIGTTSLEVVSNDNGNTGPGGPLTDTDYTYITVEQFNHPPVNTVPGTSSVDNQSVLVFDSANNNAFSFTDPDIATDADAYSATFTVTSGTLAVTGAVGNGTAASPLVLSGTITNIDAALAAGLTFTPEPGFTGAVTLTMVSNDGGNTGQPGPLTDTDSVTINVTAKLNQPPVNSLPPTITTNQTSFTLSTANGNAISVTDPDAGIATNFQTTLTPGVGTIALATTIPSNIDVTVTGAGTAASPLVLTGDLADIQAVLAAGVTFTAPAGYSGTTTLTEFSNDNGNTGAGGAKTDTDVLSIQITALANQPPVNTLPSDFSTPTGALTLSTADGNAISVADPDAGAATNFQVTLAFDSGKLSLIKNPLVTQSGAGTVANPLLLTGELVYINALLASPGLTITPTAGFLGVGTLTVLSNDNGNTGVGGPKTDTDALHITFTEGVNQAPVNHLPAAIITSTTPIALQASLGTGLSVTDVDAGNANDFVVSLSVLDGSLSLATEANVTVTGTGAANDPMTLVGMLSDIDAVLALGVSVVPPAGFTGSDPLTIVSNDAGNTGLGGPMTDTDVLPITITAGAPVNQPPVNLLPPAITTDVTPVVLSLTNGDALSVTDPDAGTATNFQVMLTPAIGKLALGTHTNVAVTGNGTPASPLVLTGTLAAIQVALGNGLTFTPTAGYTGTTGILMVSNDNGNTGTGGAKTDTDVLPITITAVENQAPENHLPTTQSTTESTPITLSTAGGNAITVTDVDAGSATNFSVTLSVLDGALTLLTPGTVTETGNGGEAAPLVLTGSLAAINLALQNGLTFTPDVNFTGTTLVKVYSNDAGNTGAGGPMSDTDYLPITMTLPAAELAPPTVTAVFADSTAWSANFRDFVDNGFADPAAMGYPIPQGALQAQTLPWVNINELHVTFSQDVGASLTLADFSVVLDPNWVALGVPAGAPLPSLIGLSYDPNTYTATLQFSDVLPASVIDLNISSPGVHNARGVALDGEWVNDVTTGNSGNGVAGGDFSFQIFILPGDVVDESTSPTDVRIVNSTDSLEVLNTQNGLIDPNYGALGYDPRADLDGSGFINSDDSQYELDQQNAIAYPTSVQAALQPAVMVSHSAVYVASMSTGVTPSVTSPVQTKVNAIVSL